MRRNLGINVTVFRAKQGLSQTALAERAGVGRPTISRIERATLDDVSLSTIERISDALGTSIITLFAPVEQTEPPAEELARRKKVREEFVTADALFAAIEEAADGAQRYSRAGRRPKLVR